MIGKVELGYDIGFVVSCPSRVVYSNQTGGYACNHPEIQGAFVPFELASSNSKDSLQKELDDHFVTGPKYRGWCDHGIDEETAVFIDELLGTFLTIRPMKSNCFDHSGEQICFKVDREKLLECQEAWIYLRAANGLTGVLTWANSD